MAVSIVVNRAHLFFPLKFLCANDTHQLVVHWLGLWYSFHMVQLHGNERVKANFKLFECEPTHT